MKESEAKEKWCPMIRFMHWRNGEASGGNTRHDETSNCRGSACMMWTTVATEDDGEPIGDCGLKHNPLY